MSTGEGLELDRAEFFRALGPGRLARVRSLVHERHFEAHRVLFFEGEPAEFLWAVRDGGVRLYKGSSAGRITTLETVTRGEIFGALSALDQDRYPVSAEGVSRGAAWCLPRASFLHLLEEDPRLVFEVLRIVSGRLGHAQERLRSFANDAAPVRLARALLNAADHGEAHVTRRVLAEAAGTTVETAIRVLRRFEKQGLVRGSVGRLAVLDEVALRRIAQGRGG